MSTLCYQEHPALRDGRRAPKLAYLTDAQNDRLELIRRRRLLWTGRHRHFFLHEERTQFNFDRMRAQGQVITPYLSINLLRLISTTYADLLLGADPKYSAEDAKQQETIDALAKRADLHRVFYDAAVSASWSSEAMVELARWDGDVYVSNLKPDEMFPVGDRQPDGQYRAYERYAEATAADGRTRLLLVTTYAAGTIARACFRLTDKGGKGDAVDLAQWPTRRPDGTPLPDVEETRVDVPTVVWLGNELDEGEPVSDYTHDLVECQDHLNAAETQLSVVIAKHGNPKMYVPSSMVNPATGGIESSMGVFFTRSKDEVPGYITWNAELASAMENRDQRMRTMATIAELTPGLLGIDKGAVPESAEKLRLACTKAVARTRRKAKYLAPFVRTVLDTARAMEAGGKFVVVSQSPSAVEFGDALPSDAMQQANVIAALRGAQAMSQDRAVEIQIPDADAAAKEIQRLKEEAAGAAPATFGGLGLSPSGAEPGQDAPAATADASGSPAAAAGGAAGNDLRSTVGALTAIQDLQEAYYGKKLPREACIANATLMLGFSAVEAGELFPEVKPDAPTADGAGEAKATRAPPSFGGHAKETTHAA